MNRWKKLLLATSLALGLGAASAVPLRYTVELATFGEYVDIGFAPTATVVFDLDFDYDVSESFVVDPRITLVSSTLPLASDLGFSYFAASDWLVVSGADNGISVAGSTDDFYISIFSVNDTTSPSYFFEGAVSRAGGTIVAPYTGSFTRAPLGGGTPVPAPATWALLLPGLLALGLARARRRA